MRHRLLGAILVGGLAAGPARSDERIPLEHFFAEPPLTQLQISPDGAFAAGISRSDKAQRVLIVDLETMKTTQHVDFKDRPVHGFGWVNDERLLIFASADRGREDRLVGINRNGKEKIDYSRRDLNRGKFLQYGARVVSLLRGDPRNALVSFVAFGSNRRMLVKEVYRLNLYSGNSVMEVGNRHQAWDWFADPSGAIRFAYGRRGTTGYFLYRAQLDGSFESFDSIGDLAVDPLHFVPLGFAAGGEKLVVTSRHAGDRFALYHFDPAARSFSEPILSHPVVDISGPRIASPFTSEVLGVYYFEDQARAHWLDARWRERSDRVERMFPGLESHIVSWNRDETRFVVSVNGDRQGRLYLLVSERPPKVQPLAAGHPKLKAADLADSAPVSYAARDGTQIRAYLTLPPGSSGKNLPVIVRVNGGLEYDGFLVPENSGPYREVRGFDPDLQFLVSRGWAVLRPNYRGSQGFGLAHERAGFGEWGLAIQDDVSDGVRWLVEQGIADPQRICIYGAGFGGYTALVGLARTPELYRCGASYGAMTDLSLLLEDRERFIYADVLSEHLGAGRERPDGRSSPSPLREADRFGAPVFLAHGQNDLVVPVHHAERLAAALEAAGKPHELLVLPDDPVGVSALGGAFYWEANRLAYYRRLEAFFAKSLGAPAAAQPPGAEPGAGAG